MKHIRHLALCLLLALSLTTSAFAAEVPEELMDVDTPEELKRLENLVTIE